jgi:NAD(P)-dependent dehydrogenase (short-subunit alcohol dehydrogenase family)
MPDAAHRIALVTGGARGIGAETARLLASNGHDVGINYRRDHHAAHSLLDEITAAGGSAFLVQGDVSKEDSVLEIFNTLDQRGGTLMALVNNAGILFPQTTFDSISVERMQAVFAVNVIGAMLCARESIRRMSRRFGGQGGAIVNVSSVASRYGAPGEYVDYAASKGAIDTLTIGLSTEEAPHGVRVNAVRPGIIDTDIHADGGEPGRVARVGATLPMRRGGTAMEVAQVIAWLLGDEASYVTGALVDVAGGR